MFSRSLMLVVLVSALGCGGGLIGKPIDEVKSELQGKTVKEVISLMGKPTGVTEFGNIGGIDETWTYLYAARHPATRTKMTVMLKFRGGRVVSVDGL